MAQVTGVVYLHINGQLQRSKEGAKLETGGKERTAITGHKVYGYSEKVVPSMITATLAHTADTDIEELNGYTDAAVTFECDNGARYLVSNAFVTKPVILAGGEGDLEIEIAGDPAVEQ